jgi:hypothetical protein
VIDSDLQPDAQRARAVRRMPLPEPLQLLIQLTLQFFVQSIDAFKFLLQLP